MYNEQDYDAFARKMEEQFPKMYGNRYGGFCVDAGWWPIIESLSHNIQSHIDWKNQQFAKFGRGQEVSQVVVAQIKEKFGGLRFYYDGGDDTINGMVRMAESWASHVCEECGKPGKSRPGGWVKTLCDEHAAAREARYERQAKQDGLEL